MLIDLVSAGSGLALVCIGCYVIFLCAKAEKLFQVLQVDSVKHREENLEELRQIRNSILDLVDATDELDIPSSLSPSNAPSFVDSLPPFAQLGFHLLKQMKDGQSDNNGEKGQERQIYEYQEALQSGEDEFISDEETQNNESISENPPTG